MKATITAVFFIASLTGGAAQAVAANEHDSHHAVSQAASAETHAARGKVVSVDEQAGKVKLTHEPIRSLKWPKMTMDFKTHDPTILKSLKPGDQIDFEIMKMEGGYRIVKISPSAN